MKRRSAGHDDQPLGSVNTIQFRQGDLVGFLSIRPVMQSVMTLGCSKISLSMKCLYPPFCAACTSQVMVCGSLVTSERSATFMTFQELAVRCTISPSSRKTTSRVYGRKAGTSEARKYSPMPRPMHRGLAFLAAQISPGRSSEIRQTAYVPRNGGAPNSGPFQCCRLRASYLRR